MLEFEEKWRFKDGGGDYIGFEASDGERSFTCRVSRESIEDLHGATPHGVSWTTLFDPLRDRVHRALQRKCDAGQFEADGSLLLTSDDI